MNCPKCNASVADDATFCNSCGYKLSGGGQVLSTNAVISIQDKSSKLFNRVTYSTLTKVLFFSTIVAMLGGIVSMFSVVEGAYAFALPGVVMAVMLTYNAIKAFVNIDMVSSNLLAQEIRLPLTYFAYSLFLTTFADLVIGVSMLVGSWKYAEVISVYTALSAVYGVLIGCSLIIIFVVFMVMAIRANHK